jgi:hypothetical protein
MLGLTIAGCSEPEANPPAKPPIETRKTLGKTTDKILDLAVALADGGVVADPGAARGGLDAITGAHRHAAASLSFAVVEQSVKLYAAEHGSQPATYAEFMANIIKPGEPDGIRLPMLPYYQEYAFDPEKRGIVMVEFPARKEQRETETTGAAGL